ncbi:MAG: lipoprotein, partial [Myxococcaceae bacterium]|nr:lipoprotein [Myxococcaceae bacterium]
MGLRSIATLGILAALLGGCGHSTRSRADSAYERGDYETAATLYAHVLQAEPGDADAKDRLQDARMRVLAASAGEIGRVRAAGKNEEALALLTRLLARRREWAVNGDAATQKATKEHVAWADTYVRGEVGRFVAARMPLSGEALLVRYAAALRDPDLAATAKDTSALVRAAGQAACSDATAKVSVDTPFLARRVGKLCEHYGAASPPQPKLPFLVSQVSTAGDVAGTSPEDRNAIAAAVQHGLEKSVFWDASTEHAAGAATSGRNVARFSSRNTTLTRPWVESVPYQAMESYEEPYTETVPTTETYYESVPYTAYETRQRPCGNTTCTESYPVTKYRDHQRTRTVMRQQTAYRTRERVVTRYRDENRIFTFEAREDSAAYDTEVTVRIDLRQGLAPFAFQMSGHGSKSG